MPLLLLLLPRTSLPRTHTHTHILHAGRAFAVHFDIFQEPIGHYTLPHYPLDLLNSIQMFEFQIDNQIFSGLT